MSRTSGFSRRRLLSSATGLGAYIWVPRLARAAEAHDHMNMNPTLGMEPRKPPPAMDAPLIEPETRRAVDGVLQTTLRCAYGYRDIGGVRLYVRSYEGGSPGPTLRMKPGETLKIRMPNDFPPNRDLMPKDLSNPHQFNNTNFHFHGSHSDPGGISDNVMRSMLPGKSYDIEITLPADHTRGTYWYHPHHHGSADVQVASGMAGAIVVEGDFADIPEISQAEGVSPAYAAKILRVLRKGGFVKAARGKDGGYTLARPAEEIFIGNVVDLLGGRLFESSFCDSHSGQVAICTRSVDCSVLRRRARSAADAVR